MFGLAGIGTKLAAAGAFLLVILGAVLKFISMGKKLQQTADLKVTADVLAKERDVAAAPDAGRPALDQLMRDGKL